MQTASDNDSLRLEIHGLPFNDLLPAWDAIDRRGTDIPAIRWLCLHDRFYLLVKLLRRYDCWHQWIYRRCREVETSPDGYCDIWAREHYKSTIITFAGSIQEILRNREITIGLFSHTKPIAKGFLAQIQRELESNDNLKACFPDVLYQNPAKESRSWSLDAGLICRRSSNPKESTIEAHGLVDGQPTSKHFQLMIYDDVVTLESVNTPEQIQKTTKAWEISDNLGSVGGKKWIIGTRYHHADTYNAITTRGAAKLRKHPATDTGFIDGHPVLFSVGEWERKKREQGEATVSCQLLCDPLAGNERMFRVPPKIYEVRPMTLLAYLMIDPARSNKPESANTAMVVLGIDAAGNKYLLDGVAHKMNLSLRWRWMRDLWVKWKNHPGIQGIHVGYERFGAIADLDYFHERQRVEEYSFEIKELEWPRDGTKSKLDRVQRLVPDLEQGRLYVPHRTHEEDRLAYPTDDGRLTRMQRSCKEQGYEYRIARPIIRLDQDDRKYDVTEMFKAELAFFPFGGLCDLIDAASRIYDMDAVAPEYVSQESLEPEVV